MTPPLRRAVIQGDKSIRKSIGPGADGHLFLVADIEITCDVCGVERLLLHGHHLRSIREVLTRFIDQCPDLTVSTDEILLVPEQT